MINYQVTNDCMWNNSGTVSTIALRNQCVMRLKRLAHSTRLFGVYCVMFAQAIQIYYGADKVVHQEFCTKMLNQIGTLFLGKRQHFISVTR